MVLRSPVLAVLLLLTAVPAQEVPTALPAAATLEQQFEEAQRAWTDAVRAARSEEARAKLPPRPEAEFLPRFQAGAAAHAGTEAAVPYLTWIVSRGGEDAGRTAMATLMGQHVASPAIGRAVARIGGLHRVWGKDQSRAWLDQVIAKNPWPAVVHQAHYTRAAMYVGTRAQERSDELRHLAIADLTVVLAKAESKSLQGLAKGLLFEAETLEPGLPAPDIEGQDLDGVAFRLSDYKGKVVLLDFWGDW
jgi:hypothetical protein